MGILIAHFMSNLAEKIKCKICGIEVQSHKYHMHVMAMHSE
jgi:hypothetical protein